MVIQDFFTDVADTRSWGLRMARWSPLLASGLGAASIGLWAWLPAPAEYWLAEFGLGLVVSPLVIKLYRTGDSRYAGAFGLVVGLTFPLLHKVMFGSVSSPFVVWGVVPFGAGVAVALVARRRQLIEALEQNFDDSRQPATSGGI